MPTRSSLLLACDRKNSVTKGFGRGHAPVSVVYDVYGRLLPQALAPTIGFNGHCIEPLTERYALGHGRRVYDPVLRRFHSPDHMSPFHKGGLNAYVYCLGDPVNYDDPTGQFGRRVLSSLYNAAKKVSNFVLDYSRWFIDVSAANVLGRSEQLFITSVVSSNVAAGAALLGMNTVATGATIVSNLSLIASSGRWTNVALRESAGFTNAVFAEVQYRVGVVSQRLAAFRRAPSSEHVSDLPHRANHVRMI